MFSWLWTYLKRFRLPLGGGMLLVLVVCGLNLVNPLLSGSLVDDVIIGGKKDLLWGLLGIMLGVVLLKTLIRYGFQMLFEQVSQVTIRAIRQDLFDRMQRLDFGYHDRTKTGDLMALMTGDIDAVRHFVAWVIYQVLENGIIFIVSIVALFFISPIFTLALLAITPVIGLAAFALSKKVLPTFGRIRDQFSRLNSVVQENIAGNRVVRAFVREGYEIERFQVENEAYRQRNLESAAVWGTFIPLIDFLSGLLLVVLVLVGGVLIINGQLTMGQFVVFNSLIWAINNPLRMAGWLVNDVQRFIASCRRLHDLSRVEPQIRNQASAGNAVQTRLKGDIEFRNVDFAYPGQDGGLVLKGINLTVKAGQTIGIVGPTGSGKSSLVRLLCRYYDPSGGAVLLDGTDLRQLDLELVRRNVGIAMQDVFLFSDTLEGNIAFGKPDMDMETIIKASVMANAHDFIKDLPETYDTIVGERGVGLSGGQRQRVALARLLAAAPPVIILDDTTSAVDVETEERIQHSIRGLHGHCTLFVVAHRISSVKHADQIIVLDEGRIVESGTHDQLLAAGGSYAAVCRHQAGMED